MSDQIFKRKIISPAEREAQKVFREIEREAALTDYARAQKALHENREVSCKRKGLRLWPRQANSLAVRSIASYNDFGRLLPVARRLPWHG